MASSSENTSQELNSSIDEIRPADIQYTESLIGGGFQEERSYTSESSESEYSSHQHKCRHPKKTDKAIPQMNYSEISWLPRINVNEWLEHTSKMILFEWFPLTYFTIACVLAPRDDIGCS